MCGIFACIDYEHDSLKEGFMMGQPRGPEQSKFEKKNGNTFGFHRLAINGYQKKESEQPIELKGCYLICNGEIYNWKKLHEEIKIETTTFSDCEIIIHLYKLFGIKYTLQKLDGVFSFILMDSIENQIIVARDQFGVRPLFECEIKKHKYMFASEMKMISCFTENEIKQFSPGCFKIIRNGIAVEEKFSIVSPLEINFTLEESLKLVKTSFTNAVIKRVTSTDREIACLLSGGLDSSLVSAIVAKQLTPKKLHTYSIGMKGSTDLKYAKIAAEFIGTIHHSIELSSEEFLCAIENVIYVIESHDVTSVRASVGNWLISKHISENSNSKVILNGDGADECCGGYIYMSKAPNALEFDKECRRLLENIHFYDVLRSDRCISSNGLEPRTPFLDRSFVNTYLSIPVEFRFTGVGNEKKLLRDSFADSGLLPDDILYRRKEAFSDGVSSVDESWYTVISNHIEKNKLAENEKEYYKLVYEKYYGKQKCVPEPWMPKFIESSDPSARTLTSIY